MIVGYSEIDKYACKVFEHHFKGVKKYGDATGIIPEQLPKFDILTAGFPCHDFSIAGKRRGFGNVRGALFFEICRIIRIKRPKYILLENVKGLLNHSQGDTFETIIKSLDELGYDLQWQMLNSKYFGVPQNRERVFIVGNLRGERRPQIFPIEENGQTNNEIQGQEVNTITASYQSKQTNGTYIIENKLKELSKGKSQGMRIYDTKGIATTIASQAGGLGAKTGLYMVSRPHGFNKGGKRKYPNVRNSAIHNEVVCIPVLTPDRKKIRQKGRAFKQHGEPAFTLTGQDIHGIYNGKSVRRLTPKECERLQGFPDDWTLTENMRDTQRYKMLGNAVTVNVVEYIARKLFEAIKWN